MMYKTILITAAFILGTSGFVISLMKSGSETVFIDTTKLYNEFKLAKELHGELNKAFEIRKHILDSLYANLKYEREKISSSEGKREEVFFYLKKLEEECLHKQKLFEEENRSMLQNQNEKIWKQINQYTEDYGNEKGYTYILGANGEGNIMFARKQNDITQDLIIYMNDRYEDKIK